MRYIGLCALAIVVHWQAWKREGQGMIVATIADIVLLNGFSFLYKFFFIAARTPQSVRAGLDFISLTVELFCAAAHWE